MQPDSPERLWKQPSWLINQVALPANRLVAEALAAHGLRRYHYAPVSYTHLTLPTILRV